MYIGLAAKKRRGKDTVAIMLQKHGYKKFAFADKPCEFLVHGAQRAQIVNDECPALTWADFRGHGKDREADIGITDPYAYQLLTLAWWKFLEEKKIPVSDIKAHCDVILRIGHLCDERLLSGEPWTIRALMQTFGTDIGCWYDQNIWIDYADEFAAINKNVVFLDCRQPWEYDFVRDLDGTIFHIHRDVPDEEDTHSTEQGLPVGPEDFVINNNGTLDELQAQVTMIIDSFKGE